MIEHAYIHIPFCLRKCRYCSFVSGENIKNKDIYIKALFEEINIRYKNEKLKTLYIGGGTPSLLGVVDLENLLNFFNLDSDTEITIEVNPETADKKKFESYKKLGINRISLGIQTFNDDILKYIGRNHSSKDAVRTVNIIKEAGFNNVSIDLIYGLPMQTVDDFMIDLQKTKELFINHISTYGLKIEKGSYFYNKKPKKLPDDNIQAEMYNILCDFLVDFNHYEISNFAKNDLISKHNCAYWGNKQYYGFGVNASGYENNLRYKNTSNFDEYIKNPLKKEEEIFLTQKETLENEIFLALRMKKGVNINEINKRYNIDFQIKYKKIIEKYQKLDLLKLENDNLHLTRKGILLSNEIMAEFIEI